MYTLDAKININHCHLQQCSLYIIFFTYLTKTASYFTFIILNFRNFSLLSVDLFSGYTPQLAVQSHENHPMQSVGDL